MADKKNPDPKPEPRPDPKPLRKSWPDPSRTDRWSWREDRTGSADTEVMDTDPELPVRPKPKK